MRADVDPALHHSPRRWIDLEGEWIEHNLSKMVIVAIAINKLFEVFKNFEFTQQLVDAFVWAWKDSEPRYEFTDHGLIDTLFREKPLGRRSPDHIVPELLLLAVSSRIVWVLDLMSVELICYTLCHVHNLSAMDRGVPYPSVSSKDWAAKHRLILHFLRLSCSSSVPLRAQLTLFFEEACFFLEQITDILQKALFVVKNIVLVLDEGYTKYVEDTLWWWKSFTA